MGARALLRELTPVALLRAGGGFVFRQQRLRIHPRAQVLVALLRHGTQHNVAERLEADSLALTPCGACDCPLDDASIKVAVGGRTVDVCREDCARRLNEAPASAVAPKRSSHRIEHLLAPGHPMFRVLSPATPP